MSLICLLYVCVTKVLLLTGPCNELNNMGAIKSCTAQQNELFWLLENLACATQSVKRHFLFPICFIDRCTDWWKMHHTHMKTAGSEYDFIHLVSLWEWKWCAQFHNDSFYIQNHTYAQLYKCDKKCMPIFCFVCTHSCRHIFTQFLLGPWSYWTCWCCVTCVNVHITLTLKNTFIINSQLQIIKILGETDFQFSYRELNCVFGWLL